MSEDIYYYKDRVTELEAELEQAQKTIAKQNVVLYDVKKAVQSGSIFDMESVVAKVAWLVYDWK